MYQPTLYLDERIDKTIKWIQSFCPPEGYFLCCSFGKDSIVLLELAKMAGVKFDAHFHRTTVDPPELIRFGKAMYPEVIIDKPPMSMFDLILEKGVPPLRNVRYCCGVFKEPYGRGRVTLDGIRRSESHWRRERQVVSICPSQAKTMVHPILDWSVAEIWDFIYTYEIPYCSLYLEGFSRLGCIMCPNGYYKTRLREAARWPRFFAAYMRCFDKLVADGTRTWRTGEEVMRWWLEERKWDDESRQLFEGILDGYYKSHSQKLDKNATLADKVESSKEAVDGDDT